MAMTNETESIKRAIRAMGIPCKVRKGTGSHKNHVLVYLPKAARLSQLTMGKLVMGVFTPAGLESVYARNAKPETRRYSIQDLYEESAEVAS